MRSIGEHDPELVVLSVTMPSYLAVCEKNVRAIQGAYPQIRIAVGGRAFTASNRLWENWPVDFYSDTAQELIQWTRDGASI